jgi:hypothetical protein
MLSRSHHLRHEARVASRGATLDLALQAILLAVHDGLLARGEVPAQPARRRA